MHSCTHDDSCSCHERTHGNPCTPIIDFLASISGKPEVPLWRKSQEQFSLTRSLDPARKHNIAVPPLEQPPLCHCFWPATPCGHHESCSSVDIIKNDRHTRCVSKKQQQHETCCCVLCMDARPHTAMPHAGSRMRAQGRAAQSSRRRDTTAPGSGSRYARCIARAALARRGNTPWQ